MNNSDHNQSVSKVDLAILLGRMGGLRAVTEVLYATLNQNDLLPHETTFVDDAADKIEQALSDIASRNPVLREVYGDDATKRMAESVFHNEPLYVFRSRLDP